MTLNKAKQLLSELLDRGYKPRIDEIGVNNYVIEVHGVSVTSVAIQQVEAALNVTATIRSVSFE